MGGPSQPGARADPRRWVVWTLAAFAVVLLALALITAIGQDSDKGSATSSDGPAADQGTGQKFDLARRVDGDITALGDVDAPVVMVEFADYRCPFCAVFARETMPQLIKDYVEAGKLRYEWRDLPIFGQASVDAAVAARAAGEQDLFWEYHNALFAAAPEKGHLSVDRQKILEFAANVGVPDLAKFEQDLTDPDLAAAVQHDADEGTSLGASSTPVFVVNDSPIVGAQPLSVFQKTIEAELADAAE